MNVKHILDACSDDSQFVSFLVMFPYFVSLFLFPFLPSMEDSSSRKVKGQFCYTGSQPFRSVTFPSAPRHKFQL